MTTEQIKEKLKVLRMRWLKEPDNREIIKRQGIALKRALETKTETYEEAKQIFS